MTIMETTLHKAKISHYTIVEKIEETKGSIVYRGYKENDEKKYIIKELKASAPTVSEIARFKHEYEIIKKIDLEGVIKTYDILEQDNRFALVLEDFDAVALQQILKDNRFDLSMFLKIAMNLAETLGFLHKNNIIHMDIKPRNILFNPTTEVVKITDFGIANEISRENMEIYNPDVITGTLAYMSPEQTGRVNRQLDYRTDIYSLGITFYEILTGSVPFIAHDPMEVIHNHIAGEVKPPAEIDPTIPELISDIVCKLLAKIPEERYQNCYGLLNDLQECQKRLEATGRIDEFKLGKNDISLLFTIPQVLVGREKELGVLENAIERGTSTDEQSELLLVTGAPGIGKSSLIQEIQKSIVAKRGYFISGKYDQFRRDVPYSAFIKAVNDLIHQILIEDKERVIRWKERLLKALGANGRVITNIIPDLTLIIGEQPEIEKLGPEANLNRFNYVFGKFAAAIAVKEHPIFLFLDDLQWVDRASLNLINLILADIEIKYFLIIGSYRDNEVDPSHPLTMMLEKVEKTGKQINSIHLDILASNDVNEIISRFLRCDKNLSVSLADLVHKKTNGNPFFVNQFMKTLYDKGLFTLDPISGWQWDMGKIQEAQITENVVELMVKRIANLPPNTQEILTICSCIGNRFNLEFISRITNKPIDEVLEYITYATKESLLYKKDDIYIFQHDRIREAAYSLVPHDKKDKLHYQIGHLILEQTKEEDLDDMILFIVDHLNAGRSLIESDEERYQSARLNLRAGQKAKASSAYESALTYLSIGIDLIHCADEEECWTKQYELSLSLYSEAANASLLTGNYDKMEQLSEEVLQRAKSFADKVDAYFTKIQAAMAQEKPNEATDIAVRALAQEGIKFPKKPGKVHALIGLIKIMLQFRGKTMKDILELPTIKDPRMHGIMRIMASCSAATYFSNPDLLPLMIFKSLEIALQYGNSEFSPYYSYGGYGFALCSLGMIDSGYEYGKLSLDLVDKMNIKGRLPNTSYVMNTFIRHWKEHIKSTVEPMRSTIQLALEVGEFEWTAFLIMQIVHHQVSANCELTSLERETARLSAISKKLNYKAQYHFLLLYHQIIHNFMGKNENPCQIKGEIYDEDKMVPIHIETRELTIVAHYYLFKMILTYLFGEINKSILETIRNTKIHLNAIPGTFTYAEFFFFESLIHLELYDSLNQAEKKKALKRVGQNQKKIKTWMKHCPANYENKFYLIEAERMRIAKKYHEAVIFYNKSIESARRNEFFHEQGIANERAAKMFLKINKEVYAQVHLQAAHYCFSRWGAIAKVRQLEKKYGYLQRQPASRADPHHDSGEFNADSSISSNRSITAYGTQTIDLSTLMKAAQTISGEIDLGNLLEKMMKILLENAGAQRGFLLLEKESDKNLYIEAEGAVNKEIRVLSSIPLENNSQLSTAIVYYVKKTRKTLVLKDAINEGRFTNDPYVKKMQSKSIFCEPIMNKGTMTGLIYLENNLTTNAFSPDNFMLLRILSSQAAISIENARLFETMKEKERLKQEMKIAEHIQTSLCPAKVEHPELDIAAIMKPAEQVGGDYYDFLYDSQKNLWFAIGDVSGHGVTPGLIMMMAQTINNTIVTHFDLQLDKVIQIINTILYENVTNRLNENHFMTFTLFKYLGNGEFLHSGAHLDLMIYRQSTQRVEFIETEGTFLNVLPDISELTETNQFQLGVGDKLILYSDGLTEAMNKEGKLFDTEGITSIIEENGGKNVEELKSMIIDGANKWSEDCQKDDITLVLIERKL